MTSVRSQLASKNEEKVSAIRTCGFQRHQIEICRNDFTSIEQCGLSFAFHAGLFTMKFHLESVVQNFLAAANDSGCCEASTCMDLPMRKRCPRGATTQPQRFEFVWLRGELGLRA